MLVHSSRLLSGIIASFCGVMLLILTFVAAGILGYNSIGQPESKEVRQPWDNTLRYPYDMVVITCALLFTGVAGIHTAYQAYRPDWVFKTDEEYLWAKHYVFSSKDGSKRIKSERVTSKISLTSIKSVYIRETAELGDDGIGYGYALMVTTTEDTHTIELEPLDPRKEKLVKMIENELARARSAADAQEAKPFSTV